MLFSLGLLFLVGLSMASLCEKIKCPRIIGMLICGVVLGPYVLDLFDPQLLNISTELRQIALVIILLRAGLSLDISQLKEVGVSALLMGFLPASFEIVAYYFFAPIILGITHVEALVMGAVLSAVSPAVVLPRMLNLIEQGYGTKKRIPHILLTGASLDDIFVIVLFSTFTAMASGSAVSVFSLLDVPISIITGIALGASIGIGLGYLLEKAHAKHKTVRNSKKILIILGLAFLLLSLEKILPFPFSGLLSVVSMALAYKNKTILSVSQRLAQKFNKLWIAAEIILFVLVGATVNISYAFQAGFSAILMIVVGLCIRAIGVLLSLIGTPLNAKEKLFCVIAYLPKATVQAAIGSVPLAMGLPCGELVLTVAVLSILLTAPLGAVGIDYSYKKILEKETIIK